MARKWERRAQRTTHLQATLARQIQNALVHSTDTLNHQQVCKRGSTATRPPWRVKPGRRGPALDDGGFESHVHMVTQEALHHVLLSA
eukprot:596787-Amphidinium_carterae.3